MKIERLENFCGTLSGSLAFPIDNAAAHPNFGENAPDLCAQRPKFAQWRGLVTENAWSLQMETIIAITPGHCLDPQIAIAARKAGGLAILDLGWKNDAASISAAITKHFRGARSHAVHGAGSPAERRSRLHEYTARHRHFGAAQKQPNRSRNATAQYTRA